MPVFDTEERSSKRQKTTSVPFTSSKWWNTPLKDIIPTNYSKLQEEQAANKNSTHDLNESSKKAPSSISRSSCTEVASTGNFPRLVTEENLINNNDFSDPHPESMQNFSFVQSSKPMENIASLGISPTAAFLRVNKRDYVAGNYQQQHDGSNQPPLLAFLAHNSSAPFQRGFLFEGNYPRTGGIFTSQNNTTPSTVEQQSNSNVSYQQSQYQLQERNYLDLSTSESIKSDNDVKFRVYQAENWTEKFGK
jgi:hypothetical protein